MLAEHARGDSLRTIGRRHGVGHETVRRVVLAQGSSLIRDLERDLRARDWPTILIPFGQQPVEWQEALLMLEWARKRLWERGWDVRVCTRPSRQGAMFKLTIEEEKSP